MNYALRITHYALAVSALLFIALPAHAQWKRVEQFVRDGRPQSALAEAKRLTERSTTAAERLRGTLYVGQLQCEITPDSFFCHVARLDSMLRAATSADERAVTALALASVIDEGSWRAQHDSPTPALPERGGSFPPFGGIEGGWSYTDYRNAADYYRTVAWSQPFDSLHAVAAKEWVPVVQMATEGKDVLASRWWGQDLLHIVVMGAPDSIQSRVKAFYATLGMSEPEIEDYIRRSPDSVEVCRQGISLFPREKRVAVLRNNLMTLECPEMTLDGRALFYPGHAYTLPLHLKNVESYTTQLYRLDREMNYRWTVDSVKRHGAPLTPPERGEAPSPFGEGRGGASVSVPDVGYYALVLTPRASRPTRSVTPLLLPIDCSRLHCFSVCRADGYTQLAVVDAMSGQPQAGVKVAVRWRNPDKTLYYTTDATGRTLPLKGNGHTGMQVRLPDGLNRWLYVPTAIAFGVNDKLFATHSLFTDRSIYRPGQTVNVGLVAYRRTMRAAQVDEGATVPFAVRRGATVLVTDTMLTDRLGTASASFVLPADAEPGLWSVRTDHGTVSFRVEEYKRPTFSINLSPSPTGEGRGEAVLTFVLTATNYAGTPLRGAQVTGSWDVNTPWWRYASRGWEASEPQGGMLDTLTTDAQGRCIISVPCEADSTHRFRVAEVRVKVTSASGESHDASLRVPIAKDALSLDINVPQQQERDHLRPWDVKLRDAAGNIVKGDIDVQLLDASNDSTVLTSHLSLLTSHLQALPSGRYTAILSHGDMVRDTCRITLFSVADTTVPDTAWFYASADTLPCVLHVGSCVKGAKFYYTAYDGAHVVADTLLTLDACATAITLPRAEHSDGLSVSLASMCDEQSKVWTHMLHNPRPVTRLTWQWDTFRDHTTPGGHECWSGTLLRPDGTPADANVMLTVYDASLDAIYPHRLDLSFMPQQQIGYASWSSLSSRQTTMRRSARFTLPYLYSPSLRYHTFCFSPAAQAGGGKVMLTSSRSVFNMPAPMMASKRAMGGVVEDCVALEECVAGAAPDAVEDEVAEEADVADGINPGTLRGDFTELAVFAPSLRTDSEGRFTLDFTLPQSVTTWQLRGVAHTADMLTAATEMQSVAQKEVMVQLATPRFLRLGDRGTVSATITCLTDTVVDGSLTVEVLDAATMKLLSRSTRFFAGDTVIFVPVTADSDADLIVRAQAKAGMHTDGEQRQLPVLDTRMWVTHTVDLACHGQGEHRFSVPKVNGEQQTAVLQFNPAPVWEAVSALPALMEPEDDDIISLTNAYFATALTAHLAKTFPAVQQRRGLDVAAILRSAEGWGNLMQQRQRADGSFSWFAGGPASTFMTTEVAVNLARLQMLTGEQQPMLADAMDYLATEIDDEVKLMKKEKHPVLSSTAFYYLYASALAGCKTKHTDYLLSVLSDHLADFSVHHRALAAVILQRAGKRAQAQRFLTSVKEYVVCTPDRGAYIDYPGGSFTSIDRKLQTQTSLIESMVLLSDTTLLAELRRNLLQQRRVQGWQNRLFGTAAIAAVLADGEQLTEVPEYKVALGRKNVLTINTDTTVALSTIPSSITITPSPQTEGWGGASEAWGALFVKSMEKADSVSSHATGLSVRAEHSSAATLGDRITVRYVITADRDYEWVRLNVPRAAALEPVQQLSGYQYQGGLSYYLSQHDDRESLFFEHLPRGTYVLYSHFYVSHRGDYLAAPATIECLYAPEFQGVGAPSRLAVE